MAELRAKVPIKFSDKAQKTLYETCMAYKELAEMRGAENAKLRRAFNETLARLSAANEVAVVNYMDEGYCEMLREMRIEVDG